MSNSWQSLNPPVPLSGIMPARPPFLDPVLPPGQVELEVIGASDEGCALEPAKLQVFQQTKRVLGRGVAPPAPPSPELESVISRPAMKAKAPESSERLLLVFRSDIRPRPTSAVRVPARPAPMDLEPVLKKPAVWSPPPLQHHPCNPPPARAILRMASLHTPPMLPEQLNTGLSESCRITPVELSAVLRTGMPDVAKAYAVMPSRAPVHNPPAIRLIGPRLRIGLPALQ